jgi:4-aminobutyrate aminotransferase-like enzyme
MLANDLQGTAKRVGGSKIAGLGSAIDAGELPMVGELRGKGLMFAIELVEPGSDTPDAKAAALVMEATKSRGLLIGKGGLNGNVLRMAPPMTLTQEEADTGLETLLDALRAVQHDRYGIATAQEVHA